MTKLKKSSQIILVFMIRLGKKNDYFLRWENFKFTVLVNNKSVQPMKNTQSNIQIVTLFLQFSDENTDKESESYALSQVSYTIGKKCNLDRVSIYILCRNLKK